MNRRAIKLLGEILQSELAMRQKSLRGGGKNTTADLELDLRVTAGRRQRFTGRLTARKNVLITCRNNKLNSAHRHR